MSGHVSRGWFHARERGTVCPVCGRRSAVVLERLIRFDDDAPICLGVSRYCVDDGFVEVIR